MTKSHINITDNTAHNNRTVYVQIMTPFDLTLKKYIHLFDKCKAIKNKGNIVAYKRELNLKDLRTGIISSADKIHLYTPCS